MATKAVTVKADMGQGFKMESTLGNHTLFVDQPAPMGGTDAGPNPLEYLMLSLAGCIGSIGRIVANQKKLPVNGISVTVTGELETAGLLGQATDKRIGFEQFTVTVDVDADMTQEEKAAFIEEVDSRCPVSDNLMNATPVKIELK